MRKQKAKVLTEEFLVEQLKLMQQNFAQYLQVQKDYFTEYLHEQLRAQSIFLEARVDAARQDFREHIGSVQKQLNSRMDGFERRMDCFDRKIDRFEKRMDGFYSELKTVQFAIRSIKEDTIRIEQKLSTVADEHETRITQLEEAV